MRRLIALATVLVAVVAVLGTALAALPLVHAVDASAARAALSAQVDQLAGAAADTREALVDGLSQLSDPQALVAVVDPDGTVRGSASAMLPTHVVDSALAGTDVSTTVRHDRASYAVETRPLVGGGAVVAAQDLDAVRSLSADVLSCLTGALAIGFAAAAIVALLVSRRLSRPLVRLAGGARALAAGDRAVRFPPSGIAEVNEVEAALEALGEALAHSEARQREFLLSVSHELRTPLTAIRGYASALRDGLIAPDRAAEAGATMDAEAERLAAFTDDLLALARLEADDFPIRPAPVEIGLVLDAAAAAWREAAEAAEVALEVVAEPLTVTTDAIRVRQIVDGLIENALRVSPAGSVIRLGCSPGADGWCIVEVADAGPGLTADDAAHAFERGVLRERYRDIRRVGTGLGLSIAARLTTRLGGLISAHPADGEGTVFRIALPGGAPPPR